MLPSSSSYLQTYVTNSPAANALHVIFHFLLKLFPDAKEHHTQRLLFLLSSNIVCYDITFGMQYAGRMDKKEL